MSGHDYMGRGHLSGTYDRGDGEADLEWTPPRCPDRELWGEDCGGDAYSHKSLADPTGLIRCSDCDGLWDSEGEPIASGASRSQAAALVALWAFNTSHTWEAAGVYTQERFVKVRDTREWGGFRLKNYGRHNYSELRRGKA